jgi:twitching motility two-component system response regulator PilH
MSARKRVLVIDSDSEACDLIAETLGAKGFEVFPFLDPDEGVAKAGESRPDLVFISILFSGANGLKISRAVHSVEGLQRVPVIMLISFPDELDVRYTSTIGIVDVALKPVNAEEILSKTVAVLGEGIAPDTIEEECPEVLVRKEVEAASPGKEWMTFPDREDRETEGARPEGLPVHEAEEDLAAEVFETGDAIPRRNEDDTADVTTDEEDYPEFVIGSQRGPMKRFFSIATAVFVLVVGAGIGAYLFFQGQGSKIVTPVARLPLKKAPVAEKAAEVSPSSSRKGAGEAAKEAARVQKGTYSVQVGAFRDQKNAAALIEKLRKKGYDAFILNEPGRAMHRVLIGKFGSRGEAAAQAKIVFEREGLKSIVFRY